MNKVNELLKYQKEISYIQYALNILRWDLRISTPKKAQSNLIDLITNYENKLFALKTSTNYGILLEETINSKEFSVLEEPEQRYIRNLFRQYSEFKSIPTEFYSEYVELKNRANVAWKDAKEQNNYDIFKPYLKQIIEMTKKYYRYIDGTNPNLYDVMLNSYETGMTSNVINELFESLKQRILPLISNIKDNNNQKINIEYTNQELIDCARFLLNYIGFDNDKGALGIYPHGYTEKMCQNDIRIAFKKANDPIDFVTTIIHEGGHGIFEQNISEKLSRYENTTVENLYALHESQSRFYENILGRNKNFWIPIYDEIKKMLKLELSLDDFVKLLNTPSKGLIRTQADELTYCMHIILRYEIERDIFNDKISVDDIPNIWNKKMREYLDVDVDSYSNGLMQDVHWSEGNFGYFPSYLLGSIYDGMFMEAIERDLGSIDELLKNGKIKLITDYLIKNIYVNGGAYTSTEIINKLCGREITVEPIAKHFEKKYGKN